jgi:hypothetical protein
LRSPSYCLSFLTLEPWSLHNGGRGPEPEFTQ